MSQTKQTTPKSSTRKKKTADSPKQINQQEPVSSDETLSLFADTNITMKTGHMVKDAEIVGDGRYAKLRFATNKQYEADGEIKTNTNYFDAMVSQNLKEAFEAAKDFRKGDWIYVKGEDSTKSFDTPEGYKKTASTIFAYKVVLKKEKASSTAQGETEINQTVGQQEPLPA